MKSIRLQILEAIVAQLALPEVTVRGVTYEAPANLDVELDRVEDVRVEDVVANGGPILDVFPEDSRDFDEMGDAQTETLRFHVSAAIQAGGAAPIAAVDPVRLWVSRALQANKYLDVDGVRLCRGIRKVGAEDFHSLYPQSSILVGGFQDTFHVPFTSRVDDPAARS